MQIRHLHRTILGVLALGLAGLRAQPTSTATVTAPSTPTLRINEVLAANTQVAIGSGFPDAIELHNAGAAAVDLTGKSLSDDPAAPRKYTFVAGATIPAGGYLVVFADTNTSAPGIHAGFALDAEGDQVRLYDAGGGTTPPLIDSITFGFQLPNRSISRTGASANTWALTAPTLGAVNGTPLALGEPSSLKLNEWAGKIRYRLDHDMIELFGTTTTPVAIGRVRLTDNIAQPTRFTFPLLSFVEGRGFLPLYGADFAFGLDGDLETISLLGENNQLIDQAVVVNQPFDVSNGRSPDGASNSVELAIPSPGISNTTPFPAAYTALLQNLRITEVMYQPAAPSNSSDFEFIELQNTGATPLDLSGVRFTNGLVYEFPAGTTLAAGAYILVVNDRSSFNSRYPGRTPLLAPGGFNGALNNSGDTIALTLPAPWKVHILRFRFEPTWQPLASGEGHSLVIPAPATTAAQAWQERTTWRASAALNGSPGAPDTGQSTGGTPTVTARLVNLSILTDISLPGDFFTLGYVVGGPSGSKQVVVRAAGPSLIPLNVDGVLADPKFELYAGSTKTQENNNWGGSSTLSAAFSSVGAFAYAEPASLDAALVTNVGLGDNSVTVSANGSGTGKVIAEVYDATPASTLATTPRLVNVSVLKHLGDELTVGFVIDGTGSKTVLIRVIGPTLGLDPFRLSDVVLNPQFTLYADARIIGSNDDWGGTPALTTAFKQVAAFDLAGNSRDAALVAPLQPGKYTVVANGVGGTTGVAIVEVYEMP